MERPKGFEIHDQESHVCRSKKSLYDLKQAPRAWCESIDNYLMKLRCKRSKGDSDHCFRVVDDKPLILVLYVDDLYLTSTGPLIYKRKRELDSGIGMVNCKPMITSMELNF